MTARRFRLRRAAPLLGVLLTVAACSGSPETDNGPAQATPAPSGSVAAVCDQEPAGPAAAPAGAVVVDPAVPGDLAAKTRSAGPGTTFWLKPGKHILGEDTYEKVSPKDGDV